nr:cupin domain-containing protein [Clostridium sp.]
MIFRYDNIKEIDLGGGVSRKILAHNENLMAVEVSFEKNSVGALHKHEHEQISYVLKGSFKVTISGNDSILKEGDTYYTAPDEEHGVLALEDGVLLDIFTPERKDFLK